MHLDEVENHDRCRNSLNKVLSALLIFILLWGVAAQSAEVGEPNRIEELDIKMDSGEAEDAIQTFSIPEGFQMELVAAEPLLANPVAFCIDERGRFFVAETFRHGEGVLDVRGRVGWEDREIVRKLGREIVADYLLNEELANKTVQESEEMLKKHFRDRIDRLQRKSEQIRMVVDTDGDGRADKATVFSDGYDGIVAGIGAGVIARGGKVWYTCIPDLWQLEDRDEDGRAEIKKSLLHGFGVRVGFLGHDLHGLVWGPDGKLYFSVGDRGAHVETEDEHAVSNPETGAIYRCNPDGSELEIFHYGLRNPQELAFDQYGNLWTGDNNSDGGDPARWVYAVPGGDSGWRIGYQFIEQPNSRGPWLAERMCYPFWDGQAASIVPPIANIGNGPSGLTYDPGTGLPERYKNHFFMCDFRGAGANSGVHSFAVRPKGASFEVTDHEQFLWNVLVTDVDFGYDGSLYVTDWVQGWSKPGRGRIYRLTDPEAAGAPVVEQTERLIARGVSDLSIRSLVQLLQHPDRRLRLEAQYGLAKHGEEVIRPLTRVARNSNVQLARIHALWGLGMVQREHANALAGIIRLVNDRDPEIRAQAIKVLGEAEYGDAYNPILRRLKDEEPRVRFFAAMAMHELGRKETVEALFELLAQAENKDPYLRHAGVMGLVGIGDREALLRATDHDSTAVRIAAVVALRRLEDPRVEQFLDDESAQVMLEAARAVNDASLYEGLPKLASLIERTGLSEPLLRRVINAHLRLGTAENAMALAEFATRSEAPESVRIEALQCLAEWPAPTGRDRVTGLWRPLEQRPAIVATASLEPQLEGLLKGTPVSIQLATVKAIQRLRMEGTGELLLGLVDDGKIAAAVRIAAVQALADLDSAHLKAAVQAAAEATDERLRAEATKLQSILDPEGAIPQLRQALQTGGLEERQAAFSVLAKAESSQAESMIIEWMEKLLAGNIPSELQFDVLQAARAKAEVSSAIRKQLQSYEQSMPEGDAVARHRPLLYGGDANEGRRIFFERQEAACLRCHKVNGTGGEVGPDLTGIGSRQPREYLLESILEPNAVITEGYQTVIVALKNGVSYAGVVTEETPDQLVLNSPEDGIVSLKKAQIADRNAGLSAMPAGMLDILTEEELRDLVEYLSVLR